MSLSDCCVAEGRQHFFEVAVVPNVSFDVNESFTATHFFSYQLTFCLWNDYQFTSFVCFENVLGAFSLVLSQKEHIMCFLLCLLRSDHLK